jgi:hypothetical protein
VCLRWDFLDSRKKKVEVAISCLSLLKFDLNGWFSIKLTFHHIPDLNATKQIKSKFFLIVFKSGNPLKKSTFCFPRGSWPILIFVLDAMHILKLFFIFYGSVLMLLTRGFIFSIRIIMTIYLAPASKNVPLTLLSFILVTMICLGVFSLELPFASFWRTTILYIFSRNSFHLLRKALHLEQAKTITTKIKSSHPHIHRIEHVIN